MHRASSKLDKNLSYLKKKSEVLLFLELPGSDRAQVIKNPPVNGGHAKEIIEEVWFPGQEEPLE